jgi:hypothetical protein
MKHIREILQERLKVIRQLRGVLPLAEPHEAPEIQARIQRNVRMVAGLTKSLNKTKY